MSMVSTFDNAAPLDGWQVQPGIHCGQLCVDVTCPVCLEYVRIPTSVELGEN